MPKFEQESEMNILFGACLLLTFRQRSPSDYHWIQIFQGEKGEHW